MINAVNPEIFGALKVAIRKVQTFGASVLQAVKEFKEGFPKNEEVTQILNTRRTEQGGRRIENQVRALIHKYPNDPK